MKDENDNLVFGKGKCVGIWKNYFNGLLNYPSNGPIEYVADCNVEPWVEKHDLLDIEVAT